MKEKDLYWHEPSVNLAARWKAGGFKSCVIWFTGLSASGKSTVANGLSEALHQMNINSYLLDGDNIRHGLNRDLGFSEEDRHENIRRIAEVSRLLQDAGLIVLTAFISPFREDRKKAREIVNPGDFIEVFLKCPLPECERRDPKGIYKRAKRGDIKEFTGISSPYEEPEGPEIILETDKTSPSACVEKILSYLFENGYFNK